MASDPDVCDTFWLFGLPFDVLTLEQMRSRIFLAADSGPQLVFATANANFLSEASVNPIFREDVLRADVTVADGMPVLWLGRLLNIPLRERVAGSDLLASLVATPGPRPLRTYFFGGEEGAAAAAMEALNSRSSGLIGVGSTYPGFGSLDDISTEAIIQDINRTHPDLLVVALGAVKGHRWIEANRHRLNARVISHLGAAINFVSGRIRRAPRWMHGLGLEWLWRAGAEPRLFRRYSRDALFLLGAATQFFFGQRLSHRKPGDLSSRRIEGPDFSQARPTVRINEALCGAEVHALRAAISCDAMMPRPQLTVQLCGVRTFDPLGIAWLYKARYRPPHGVPPARIIADQCSMDSLRRFRAEFLSDSSSL